MHVESGGLVIEGLTGVSVASRTREIAVIGAGGHGREVADIVRAAAVASDSVSLLGIIDDGAPDRSLLARSGLRFLGASSFLDGRSAVRPTS